MKKSKKLFEPETISLVLIILQLIFKVWVELIKSQHLRTEHIIVDSLFWSGTLGWVVIIPLLILKHRASYLVASLLGILNGIVGGLFPLIGVCHHYIVGPIIFIHGFLIAYFSYKAYRKLTY
ncbi:MAG: hypothetical protein H8D22_04580 [Candidatus Cloacimonetes bacterium]|nr:hypothetical protein [Candidatus Cloacimonadota bacterium]